MSGLREPLIDNSDNHLNDLTINFNKEFKRLEKKDNIFIKEADKINTLYKEIKTIINNKRNLSHEEAFLNDTISFHVELYNKIGLINTKVSESESKNAMVPKKLSPKHLKQKTSFFRKYSLSFEDYKCILESDTKNFYSQESEEDRLQESMTSQKIVERYKIDQNSEEIFPNIRLNCRFILHLIFSMIILTVLGIYLFL